MGKFGMFYKSDIPEKIWGSVYTRLEKSGRLADSFPNLGNCDFETFFSIVAGIGTSSWVVTYEKQLAGIVYLTDLDGTSAKIHFAFLPVQGRDERGAIPVLTGRYAISTILRSRTADGGYVLDSTIGVTPCYNTQAIKLIKQCGAVVVGDIPGIFPIFRAKRNISGLVSYFTRESTEDAWRSL